MSTNTDTFSGYDAGKSALRFPAEQERDEFVSKAQKSAGFHCGPVSPPRDTESYREYADHERWAIIKEDWGNKKS